METESKILAEVIQTMKSIKEDSVNVQAKLLLESQKTNELYTQILHQLSIQNQILRDRKIVTIKK